MTQKWVGDLKNKHPNKNHLVGFFNVFVQEPTHCHPFRGPSDRKVPSIAQRDIPTQPANVTRFHNHLITHYLPPWIVHCFFFFSKMVKFNI